PGRSDLYILDLRKKTTLPLPTGQSVAIDPNWSPDGALIAFVSVGSGGSRTICLRDLASGQTRRLTNGSQPVWGADSRHLLFVSGNGLSMIQIDTGKTWPVIVGAGRAVDPTWTR
ncbi:MAG: PD40 domain-containing protein, partial [Verrucomicrobiae bacterium]|nr:PD40 domain-containing protein [Verrucomicrobiae bacterium]